MVGQGLGTDPTSAKVIALFLSAGDEGLFAEDYDGRRWGARLASLKPATKQPEAVDAVKFDLALTVCVMRGISDLHIGKVNTKHSDFVFYEEPKKYDLAEFLKDRAVDGRDIAGVLAQIEPPYPGYRRTLQALQSYTEFARKDEREQFPHIGADEHNLRSQFVADDGEKSPKGFDGSFAAHPKQARDVEIDLINQSQVLVAFGILDLIDADRIDLAWHPVLQPERVPPRRRPCPRRCERPPPSLPMTVAAPNGLKRSCRFWSVCVCRRPRELLRQSQCRSGDS